MTEPDHGDGKVLVTGAAGRLGSQAAGLLHDRGYSVVATDRIAPAGSRYPFIEADLLDHEAVRTIVEGIATVVQIGNHPGLGARPPQVVFNENVSMNTNVFQAAAERGVGRIVFASTLQLIGSRIDHRTVRTPPAQPIYPLTGDAVPDPSNLYALSKTVSERILRYYAERCGVTGISIRFPMLHRFERRIGVTTGDETPDDVLEGFTGMSYQDAARLIEACVAADLSGYHRFQPGSAHRHRDLDLPELLCAFYPSLPGDLADLVDQEPVTAATGWHPGVDPPDAFTRENPS